MNDPEPSRRRRSETQQIHLPPSFRRSSPNSSIAVFRLDYDPSRPNSNSNGEALSAQMSRIFGPQPQKAIENSTLIEKTVRAPKKPRVWLRNVVKRASMLVLSLISLALLVFIVAFTFDSVSSFIDTRIDVRLSPLLRTLAAPVQRSDAPIRNDHVDHAQLIFGALIVPSMPKPAKWSTRDLSKMRGRLGFRPATSFFGFQSMQPRPPSTVLVDKRQNPGCWPVKGDSGSLAVQFRSATPLYSVALDHSSAIALPYDERIVAPRDIQFSALDGTSLLNTTFDPAKGAQSYDIDYPGLLAGIRLSWTSNHGADFTCIHRLSAYGPA